MTSGVLSHVLLSLAFVVAISRVGGYLGERAGQPPVVGEIVAGILVGPSLLGLVAPRVGHLLLPADVRPYLTVVAQLGLVVFMVIVGLEVETAALGRRSRVVGTVALGATGLPFLLGALMAWVIWRWYAVPAGRVPFLFFLGVAFTVTAFPVLARILRDRGMAATAMGTIALACAAVIDVIAWLLLAGVLTLGGHGGRSPWFMLVLAATFVAAMLLLVRPGLATLQRRGIFDTASPRTLFVAVVVGALLAAWFTEGIGLHSIFGPFVVGLCLPRVPSVVDLVTVRTADFSSGVLLPAFFVVAGMGVDLTSLGIRDIAVLVGAVVLAMGSKLIGAAAAGRLAGMSGRHALTLGVLLSTKGLTELVVLSVGLASGLLTTTLYTILVLNAVVTTFATGPLLTLIERRTAKVPTHQPVPAAAAP